jgi:3',5'-cyclic AMP phosphodiesterase CpdA
VVVAMGNHDARNVGCRHFEEFVEMCERDVASTSGWRGRRTMHPYYNVIEFDSQEIKTTLREPGNGQGEPLAFFSRNPVITSKFFRDFDRLVKYDGIPLPQR